MDKAIEAAARIIDPLAFEEQGSCPPRGYECHTPEQLNRVIAARRRHALSVAKRMIAAYQAASGEARDGLRTLVQRAYNEGFGEGMKEHTHFNGGKCWADSKARAALGE